MVQLRLFNTLSRRKEVFKPLKPKEVKLFVCGVTVYDYVHIGHGRTYAFYDTLVRLLYHLGYRVTYLQNVTDVGHLLDTGEDRVIKKAREEHKHPLEIAEFYLQHWLEMMRELKLLKPDLMPRATQHIAEIVEHVRQILANGYAYVANGSVYFEVSKFKNYGKLSKNVPKQLIAGARVEPHPDKKDPRDFALWIKAPPEHVLKWESPWGLGYPGWHIEDTAIALKYFGPQYDIHGGAIELAFPHHEAEIAQAEAATGVKPYVRYWVHTGLLTIGGQKMSKSLRNYVLLKDALQRWGAEVLRLWYASKHYRKPLDYNEQDLELAKRKVEKLKRLLKVLEEKLEVAKKGKSTAKKKIKELRQKFMLAMLDDLNTPLALSHYFKLISLLNRLINRGKYTRADLELGRQTLVELGEFFQIIPGLEMEVVPEVVLELVKQREELRRQKRYEEADELRKQIAELGYAVEDTKEGPKLRRIK